MAKTKKTVLVVGNFDVLHPGHIRLLKFAKECGDHLIVAVNEDDNMSVKSRISERHRLEMVQSLECVDEAFLNEADSVTLINQYQPYAVVKGKEYEEKDNPELDALKSYGGKLIFGSGEFETNAEQFIRRTPSIGKNFDYSEAKRYASRHSITLESVLEAFDSIKQLNVLVIGEVIVDEYVQGSAVGLSQEDPTIVMTPNKTDTFLGGAAITAGHIKAIGANEVSLISVLGEDSAADYVTQHIDKYNLSEHLLVDNSRPTPLKTRYRAGNKTLLRVNQVRQHKISKELQNTIIDIVKSKVSSLDLLVFSDFNYGLLPQSLVDAITLLCHEHSVKVVADSQTSSQVGDISRYKGMDLITPTEREVRVALNNPDDGLVILAQKLARKSGAKNIVITLAEEGILIHLPNKDFSNWENDNLSAVNKHAVDPAGAGDCFLAASSLVIAANKMPWLAYYLGSIAAACQVGAVGNTPLDFNVLKKAVIDSFE
ncbi:MULTISPECIES: PfkB family carbohydrate kinase [Pseudoalteromonas]|uniref:ADP-heptose synthase n=1 Tax=Pseudoalteromonas amylolytica TaxID=1859457 RepID=A0A1S1MVS3_9GAMM|nr:MULTISPECIES: PfkB family carbohydrate kinase [Pseudoalteromonas]OHU87555.1 ADP-heptose synthase [Pseudoalteromonas sp. JW3]OHU90998.1 ADP-heptose synthase [Pseudoalteromonas amylolytica]